MKIRVYTDASGALRILRANPKLQQEDEGPDEFLARVAKTAAASDPTLAGLPFVDIDESRLPEGQRDKWRLKNKKVTIDPNIPDRPSLKAELFRKIDAAKDISDIKSLLKDFFK